MKSLVFPKGLEALRAKLGVAHCVRDVPMPEVLLDRSGVVPLIGELVAGRVPEHVRMDREGEFRALAGARDQLPCRRRRHRSAALRHEQVGRLRILTAELTQRPELGPADRMRRGQAVLKSRDVDQAGLQVDLLPAHRDELRHPKRMPVGEKNERPIARPVAAHLGGGLQELLDLRRRQVLAGAPIKIGGSAWGDRRGGGRPRSRL